MMDTQLGGFTMPPGRMSAMGKPRKKYTKEFKLDAVRLALARERSVREIADSLGLNESQLHQWKRKFIEDGELLFPGNGKRQPTTDLEEENRRLRKELAQAKQDREILKKAAAFFAQNPD